MTSISFHRGTLNYQLFLLPAVDQVNQLGKTNLQVKFTEKAIFLLTLGKTSLQINANGNRDVHLTAIQCEIGVEK